MRVIPLTEEHAQQYRRLMMHGYQHAPEAFTSTVKERESLPLSWWQKRLGDEAGSCRAFGAFSNQELVGCVAIEFSSRPKTRHKAYLLGMYVLASCRGMGAGKKLIAAALSAARHRTGVSMVGLTVTEGNQGAIGLYESMGFRAFGVEPMALRTTRGYLGKVHMWLDWEA